MKNIFFSFFIGVVVIAKSPAQVGINTTTPDPSSMLAIESTDKGILIPRVSLMNVNTTQLDGINTAANGLLIYNTNSLTTGGSGVGFYVFNGTIWEKITTTSDSGIDADFFEEGTTNPPDDINDNIYTLGNVAIGKNSANFPLDIDATSYRGINSIVRGTDNIPRYGVYSEIAASGTGEHYGFYNLMSGTSNASKYGLYNFITNNGSAPQFGVRNQIVNGGTGNKYGTFNNIAAFNANGVYGTYNFIDGGSTGDRFGTYNQLTNSGSGRLFGSFTVLSGAGTGIKFGDYIAIANSVPGTHYGVYSDVNKAGSFAGYFRGRLAVGTTDYTSGTPNYYVFPPSRGTNGQVMQTDGSGNISWVNLPAQTNDWSLTGNAGTDSTIHFIGTTDNQDLSFRRNNIAFGRISLNNISIGSLAHSLVTTGLSNTAIGNGANRSVTTGSQNTAIGNLANFSNVSANNNTAIGARALQDNTVGEQNVAIGVVASYRNTSGFRNVAIGTGALQENEIGSDNVNIGFFSGLVKETSSNNVFVGSYAGYDNSGAYTSSNNVFIGYNAGRESQNASGNVFIGYNAGFGVNTNNKLYIENSIGQTPLIYGEFDNDILRTYGDFQVNNPTNTTESGLLQNDDSFEHAVDANIDFGAGGNHVMLSSQEGGSETGGIHLDGNSVSIWSPADNFRALRILDEDNWNDNDGNPYDNGAELAYIDNTGQYVQASDENRKQNIKKLTQALSSILQLNGYTYEYKLNTAEIAKGEKPRRTSGVLAQELQKVLPEAVQVSEDGEYFVHYAGITPLLIEAIKELKLENEVLKHNQDQLRLQLARIELLLQEK